MSTQEAFFDRTNHISYASASASMDNELQFIGADMLEEGPKPSHGDLVDFPIQYPVDPGLNSLMGSGYVPAYDVDGPQYFYEPQVDLGSSVPPPMAASSSPVIPMAVNYPQGSGSSPDPKSRPLTWTSTSQDSWSSSAAEYECTQHPFNGVIGDYSQAFIASASVQKLSSSQEPDIHIVMEDPNISQCFREKKVRSRADLEKQKQAVRLLREFGGACLWCYRSKKKCGPSNPCPSCVSNRRKCIRNSTQICLLQAQAEGKALSSNASMTVLSPPSHEALRTLYSMIHKVAANRVEMRVVVDIRQPDDGLLDTWVLDMTETEMTLSNPSALRFPVGGFVALTTKFLRCIELAKLETEYSSHPLVQDGLAMSRLFMTMRCLAQTQIYVGPLGVDPGRLTMFYLLVACSRELAQMSEGFCAALCEALRRKDVQDAHDNEQNRSRTTSLNPLWVASALYYRVVCGLSELQASPLIAKVFKSFDSHLSGLRSSLWSILKCVSPTQDSSSKGVAGNALNEQIPVLPLSRYFDLALWLAPLDSSRQLPPPTVLERHGDPFSESCYEMESFLDDELTQPNFLPDAPQPVQDCTVLPHASEQVVTRLQDSMPLTKGPIAPTGKPDGVGDLLDPLDPGSWDVVDVIDRFYDENHQGVFATESQTADESASFEAYDLSSMPQVTANGVRNMI